MGQPGTSPSRGLAMEGQFDVESKQNIEEQIQLGLGMLTAIRADSKLEGAGPSWRS